MPVGFNECLVTKLVLQVNPESLNPVASRVCCRDARQVAQHMQDGPLVGRLLEVLTPIRVDISCLVEECLGLDLTVGVLRDTSHILALCTGALTHIMTVARLLHHIALLRLARADFDLFVTNIVTVLVRRHFVGLVALARHARPLGLSVQLGLVLISIHQCTVLLKFDLLNRLPVVAASPVTREVLSPRLVPSLVYLGNLFADTVRLFNKAHQLA